MPHAAAAITQRSQNKPKRPKQQQLEPREQREQLLAPASAPNNLCVQRKRVAEGGRSAEEEGL